MFLATDDNGDVVAAFLDRDKERDLVVQPPKGFKLVPDDPAAPENDNQTPFFVLKLGKMPKPPKK